MLFDGVSVLLCIFYNLTQHLRFIQPLFQGYECTNITPASNFDINECLSKKNPACESDDDGEEDDMPELTQRNEESDDEELDWEDASIEDTKPMARKKIKRDPEVCYLLTSDFIFSVFSHFY